MPIEKENRESKKGDIVRLMYDAASDGKHAPSRKYKKWFKNFSFLPNKSSAIKSKAPENLLIKGDSLEVMQTLSEGYAGKVKLIYIDPPYNTGNNSFGYADTFTHTAWLTGMKLRLQEARKFLSNDGAILVQIDNSPSTLNESPELGYLLVLMDEIFGRKNYITTFTWQKKGNPGNTQKSIGTITESILMYAKDANEFVPNQQEYPRKYKFTEQGIDFNLEYPVKTNSGTYERKTMLFGIKTPQGTFFPPKGKRWTIGEALAKKIVADGNYRIVDGKFKVIKQQHDYKRGNAKPYNNLLVELGSLKLAKDELLKLGFEREAFGSPKPEVLMHTLIAMCTKPGDCVMDYYLGSGTTAAVALKMGRRFIGIEKEGFIKTLTLPRLKQVVCGEQGGISKKVKWKGGGSFVYCEICGRSTAMSDVDKQINAWFYRHWNDI